jgi:hypothetical protein
MLPLWVEFNTETDIFGIDDQHMIGIHKDISPGKK